MHEFSVAQNIVDIALQSAKEHQVDCITSVEVEIGQAAGVVVEALEFAWDSATKDTMLQHTVLVIKPVPLVAVCRNCRLQYNPQEPFELCPQCGSMNPEIVKGRELRVSAIVT